MATWLNRCRAAEESREEVCHPQAARKASGVLPAIRPIDESRADAGCVARWLRLAVSMDVHAGMTADEFRSRLIHLPFAFSRQIPLVPPTLEGLISPATVAKVQLAGLFFRRPLTQP